jgi:hypothetical protein
MAESYIFRLILRVISWDKSTESVEMNKKGAGGSIRYPGKSFSETVAAHGSNFIQIEKLIHAAAVVPLQGVNACVCMKCVTVFPSWPINSYLMIRLRWTSAFRLKTSQRNKQHS